MTDNDQDEESQERFYLFSLRVAGKDLIVSIPAEDESMAHSVLDKAVQNPDSWVREKKLEEELKTIPITGRRKEGIKPWHPPVSDNGTGPMFG